VDIFYLTFTALLSPPTRRRLCDRSVIHYLSEQDYWKNIEPISLKLCVIIGPTDRKNWLTFGGAPVSDTDFMSLFHFPHHCGIGGI